MRNCISDQFAGHGPGYNKTPGITPPETIVVEKPEAERVAFWRDLYSICHGDGDKYRVSTAVNDDGSVNILLERASGRSWGDAFRLETIVVH